MGLGYVNLIALIKFSLNLFQIGQKSQSIKQL